MGLPGFSDDETAAPPLALGYWRGYRGWGLRKLGTHGALTLGGAYGWPWPAVPREERAAQQSRLYVATCQLSDEDGMISSWDDEAEKYVQVPHGAVPSKDCSCGFWAYWNPDDSTYRFPVAGVIRGSGKAVRGPLGFRAGKVRIQALALAVPGMRIAILSQMRSEFVSRKQVLRDLEIRFQLPVFPSVEDMIAMFPPDPQPPLEPEIREETEPSS